MNILKLTSPLSLAFICLYSRAQQKEFHPGQLWPDNKGVNINAHGGGMLYQKGTYYWFGELKMAGNVAMVGLHCSSSKDLYNWKDEGISLAVSQDSTRDIAKGCVLERPNVIYNKKQKNM